MVTLLRAVSIALTLPSAAVYVHNPTLENAGKLGVSACGAFGGSLGQACNVFGGVGEIISP